MTKINDAKSLGRSIRAVRKALGLIGKALIVLQSLCMSLEVTPPASVELTDRTIENGEPEDGPAT